MVIPFESFAGPVVPNHPLFVPGQVFHILGALLAVFGYFGLYLKQKDAWIFWLVSKTKGCSRDARSEWYCSCHNWDDVLSGRCDDRDCHFPFLAEYAQEMTDAAGPIYSLVGPWASIL